VEIKALETAIGKLLKVDVNKLPINKACAHYQLMRELQDYLKLQTSGLNDRIDLMKGMVLPQKFKEANTTSISTNGYRFTISETVRASMLDKEKGFEWLRQHDREGLIAETVNASSLAAEARRMLEAGEELPPDVFNVVIQPNVSMTKTT
jgi:hypothetical protein